LTLQQDITQHGHTTFRPTIPPIAGLSCAEGAHVRKPIEGKIMPEIADDVVMALSELRSA